MEGRAQLAAAPLMIYLKIPALAGFLFDCCIVQARRHAHPLGAGVGFRAATIAQFTIEQRVTVGQNGQLEKVA